MEDIITINELFKEAESLYYGIEGSKEVESAFKVFEEIIAIGKAESGEAIYPDIFNDLVYNKYDDGTKENIDYELAARLYELAAKNGSVDALNNMGVLFLNGFGVSQDITKAEEYWMVASKKGNSKSQMNLVTLYKSDAYEMLNYSKAKFYCKLAAKNGDERAIKLLPVLERRSDNITKTEMKNNKGLWNKLKNILKG